LSESLGFSGPWSPSDADPEPRLCDCRLRGHRDQITAIRFLFNVAPSAPSTSAATAPGFLVTSSKDTFLKLWDLSTQHCIQTVVAHRAEVWTLEIGPTQDLIFTGSNEGDLRIWRVDHEVLAGELHETETGEVRRILRSKRKYLAFALQLPHAILPAASLPLSTQHRVHQISHHPLLPYLAIQSHDRSVEVFRIRTEEEVRKKQARRKKRAKEKGKTVDEEKDDAGGDVVLLADLFTPYLIVRATGKIRSFCFPEERVEAKGGALVSACASYSAQISRIPRGADMLCLVQQRGRSLHYPATCKIKRHARSHEALLVGPPRSSDRRADALLKLGRLATGFRFERLPQNMEHAHDGVHPYP
jgi:U3 small nucleolar RNA-associated protein 12